MVALLLPFSATAKTPPSSSEEKDEEGSETLTLSQCLDLARTNNRTLQNAALELKAADEQKKEAWSNFLPQISAHVMAFRTFDEVMKGDGTYPQEIAMLGPEFASMIGMPYSYEELNRGYSTTATFMQPLYAGGQITNGQKLAHLGKDVAYLQQNLKERDVLQKVTECFWQIAGIRYNLQTIDAADKQLETVMQHVRNAVDAGVTTRNALLQVKLRQQELQSNRLRLENAGKLLTLLLAQQIGLPAGKPIRIVLPPEERIAMPVKADEQTAATGRIEYQLAGKGVEAQRLQVKMEQGKNLPSLAVGAMGYHAGFGGLSDNAHRYMNDKMTNGLVLGTLTVPLSSWIGGTHAIRRQKIRLEQARNTLLDTQEQLRIDIESSWLNLLEAYKQIEIAQVSVEEAEENLRMNMEQYKAGSITLTDLLDAETLHRKAQNDLSTAKANYQIRLADYQRKTNTKTE